MKEETDWHEATSEDDSLSPQVDSWLDRVGCEVYIKATENARGSLPSHSPAHLAVAPAEARLDCQLVPTRVLECLRFADVHNMTLRMVCRQLQRARHRLWILDRTIRPRGKQGSGDQDPVLSP